MAWIVHVQKVIPYFQAHEHTGAHRTEMHGARQQGITGVRPEGGKGVRQQGSTGGELNDVPNCGPSTQVLLDQGYWASYNVPYFPEIYNLTGYPLPSIYSTCPRARLFRWGWVGGGWVEGRGIPSGRGGDLGTVTAG